MSGTAGACPTLVDLLSQAAVRLLDWKWKVRPTDLLFDWVGDYLYKEYMATLKDFEALAARCPARAAAPCFPPPPWSEAFDR